MERLVDECLKAARIQMSHSSIFLDPFYPFPEIDARTIKESVASKRFDDDDDVWAYLKACERVTNECIHPVKPLEYVKRQLRAVEECGRFNFANYKPDEMMNETIFVALDSKIFSELVFDNVDFLATKMLVHLDGFMAGGGCESPIKLSLCNCFVGGGQDAEEFMDCRWTDWSVRSLNLSLNAFGCSGVRFINFIGF